MHSFTTMFVSLVAVAFTVAPVLASGGLGGVLNKRDLAHANLLSERLVARQPAVGAYDAPTLAKRAGRKAAKAPKTPKGGPKRPTAAQQIAASALDPYSPNGVFLNSALATSAATRRCGLDITCQVSVTVPLHATAFCVNARCTFRCDSPAFAPSGTVCIAAPTGCPNQPTCPPVNGGFISCGQNGLCVANCPANQGFSLATNQNQSAFTCLRLAVDANNCGTVGNVCPASYNGKGTPKCKAGQCTLACPLGTSPASDISTTNPTYCSSF